MKSKLPFRKTVLPSRQYYSLNKPISLRMWLLLLFVCVISIPISAQDGNLWVNAAYRDVEFAGSGTETDPYLITGAAELAGLAYLVNEYNGKAYNSIGKYYKLTTDIDLNAHLWEPIGYFSLNSAQPTHYFNGHFDGDGHTISNMKILGGSRKVDGLTINHGDGRTDHYKGLFGYMSGATTKTIKNLTIKNANIKDTWSGRDTQESGFVLGCCDSANGIINIENVHVEGGELYAISRSGGIVGLAHMGVTVNMTHVSCSAEINPHKNGTDCGGIIGSLSSPHGHAKVDMASAVFNGHLKCAEFSNTNCGGIVGYIESGGHLYAHPAVMVGKITLNKSRSIGIFGGYIQVNQVCSGNFYGIPADNCWSWGNTLNMPVGEIFNSQADLHEEKLSDYGVFYLEGGVINLHRYTNPQPSNFNAVAESGRVKLSWDIAARNYLTPTTGYSIQTKKAGSSTWTDVTVVEGNLNYVKKDLSKTVYVKFPGLDEDATNYEFRIKRSNEVWLSISDYYAQTIYTLPAYSYPEGFTASANPNESTITLTWNMRVQDASAPTGDYHIQWRRGGYAGFCGEGWFTNYVDCSHYGYSYPFPEISSGNLTYDRNETTKSITFPYPVMDDGIYEFHFRIRRDDYSYDTHPVDVRGLDVNTNVTQITSVSAEGSTTGINVKWEQDNGRVDKGWYFRLYRKDIDQPSFDWGSGFVTETKASDLSNRELKDSLLTQTCTAYNYVVRLEVGERNDNIEVKSTSPVMNNDNVVKLPSQVGVIESLSVSKGYYNDRVDIKWKVTAGNGFTRYTIFRKEYGMDDAVSQNIYEFIPSSTQTTDYRYTDNTAIAGNYYSYEVTAWQDCNGTATEANKEKAIGFMQPFGVVSGKVTYDGGNAVSGVSIIAENEASSQYANRAVIFNKADNTYLKASYKENMLSATAFTLQFWLSEGNVEDKNHAYFTSKNHYSLYRKNDKLEFTTWAADSELTYLFDYTPPVNEYVHISIAYSADATSQKGTAVLYVNGKKNATITQPYPTGKSVGFLNWNELDDAGKKIFLGKGYNNDSYFTGNFDEFRLWNQTLDSATIASNHNAYSSGKENNLVLYYRFDEPIAKQVFDTSGKDGLFNENHADFSGTGTTTLERTTINVPACYNKALTDANGNYLINTIPYSSEGSSVTLYPALGVHNFNPSNKPLFFNQQSNTFNNVDFTDISSFEVSGKVIYEGGTYPVEGCQFEVDGKTLVKSNGSVVTNDSDGKFTISVPIGYHEVRVVKSGHTFFNDGKLLDTNNENLNYNSPVSGVEFLDQTRVKVIGRVTGGLNEHEKSLGFGESLNNIGVEKIILKPTLSSNYKLMTNGEPEKYLHNQGQWKKIVNTEEDTTTVTYTEENVVISISSKTGEFVAWLRPINYNIENITSTGYNNPIYDIRETLNLTKSPVPDSIYMQSSVREWTDSVLVQGSDLRPGELPYKIGVEKSDTVLYHAKWQHYYQAVPSFSMKQLDGDQRLNYLGNKEYIYINEDGISDTILLVLINEEEPEKAYKFGLPVFTQGTDYKFEFSAFEVYKNEVKNFNDTAYVSSGTISLTNELPYPSSSESVELTLDSLGTVVYEFTAGIPDLTTAKKSIFATIKIGGRVYNWDYGNADVKAWMLGSTSTGTDFMTAGPDRLEIILRDPPGSNSYAYIEKGTTAITKHSVQVSPGHSFEHSGELKTGGKIVTFVGLGGGVILEAQVDNTMTLGGTTEEKFNYGFEKETKTTYTERIETSSDPLYVGHMGDVFVGTSNNILYGLANSIVIEKGSSDDFESNKAEIGDSIFSIVKTTSIALGEKFATRFVYTQIELEEIVIPKWKDNLALLLKDKDTKVDTTKITNPVYKSNLDENDPNFGKLNGDDIFGEDASDFRSTDDGPSYTIFYPEGFFRDEEKMKNFQDSVVYYNNQISTWEQVLAENEKDKVNMKKKGNYSFGSGAKVDFSSASSSSYSNSFGYNIVLNAWLGNEIGAEVNGIGAKILNKNTVTIENGYNNTSGEENTKNVGFVLQESGDDDQITVDYGMTDYGTYAFKTMGGRTSCPYEDEYVTKYYEPGKHILSNATMQIEVPKISVAGASGLINVPSNKTGSFVLELKNDSETDEDVWFQLIVDEKSNPCGAELKIDGQAIGNGRLFLVKSRAALNKTLTIGKGSVDRYENIALILRSQCQHDPTDFLENIGDTTYVSIDFIPACGNIRMKEPADNWITNTTTGDSIKIILDDFNVNLANFGYIEVEYRSSATTWDKSYKLMRFYGDKELYQNHNGDEDDNKVLLSASDQDIIYWWNQKDVLDGQYELRASSVCVDNLGLIISTSTTTGVSGIKDMQKPQALSLPSPANGILGIGDELSVLFNEDIQQGRITENNIEISGVLNETTIEEPSVGLNFSGSGIAYTEMPITTDGSFSIEGWFKRTPSSSGILFAFGANGNHISFGFNTTGNGVLKLGENQFPLSTKTITNTDEWKYISLVYDASSLNVSVYILEGASTEPLLGNWNVSSVTLPEKRGRLYLGTMPDKSNAFSGALSNVHFWNNVRTIAQFSADKNILKSGTENGLIGYWMLNEGKGVTALDKARSRHLTLETDWYIYPQGKAAQTSGSDYISIPSSEFPFFNYDDFTIEFWFKGADQSSATLFSAGHGVNDIAPEKKLSIAVNENEQLVLRSQKQENIITTNKVLDNQWHHIALTVKRNGTSNVYLDGMLIKQISSSLIGNLESNSYNFGACVYNYSENGSMVSAVENHFTGYFDDIRVWNSALSSSIITLNMNNKLTGNESGLLAYYPFDIYTKSSGLISITASDLDFVSKEKTATGFVSTNDVPTIMDCRPVEKISLFTYVTSNNKIVITIDEKLKKRIEGTTLEVSVKNIRDLQDNISGDIKWTAYINQNPLRWSTDAIDLVVEKGTSESFTATIINSSSETTDYAIENVPEWLSVNQIQGTLKPTASKEISFTVLQGTNIGTYEAAISLTGTNGISELLPVTLKVTGEKPDWSVNPKDFFLSMSMVGCIQFEGAPQEDESDILGAFIDELCVGVANPIYVKSHNAYYVFIDVLKKCETDTKNVKFKLWDASTGHIYPQILTSQNGESIDVEFKSDETKYAKIQTPVSFNAQNVIEQQIPLYTGWNWLSVNVENNNPDLLTQFKNQASGSSTLIKSKKNYLQAVDDTDWTGLLDSLSVAQTYKALFIQDYTLKMEGRPANVLETSIVLKNGWNWIGYTPQLTATVENALAGIEAKEGDQIKSQNGFSVYNENNGWIGTLDYMQPGKGYMYFSENDSVIFTYPNVISSTRSSVLRTNTSVTEEKWSNNHGRFATNMTMTSVALLENVELESGMVEIGAFAGNDCRGNILLSYDDYVKRYLGFLMVYGESDDEIHFRMYDHSTGKEYLSENTAIRYKAEDIYGKPNAPYELKFVKTTTSLSDAWIENVSIYPNPTETVLNIKHSLDKVDKLEVVDISGRTMMIENNFSGNSINVSELADGIYLLKLTSDGEMVVLKFNKK